MNIIGVLRSLKKLRKLKRKKRGRASKRRLIMVVVSIIAILIVTISLSSVFNVYNFMRYAVAASLDFSKSEETEEEEEEGSWEWEMPKEEGSTSGGLYPKEPELKQLAKLLEVIEKSCEASNNASGEENTAPSLVLTMIMRETSSQLFNRIMGDTSLDIYSQLIYENPACCKGGNCKWMIGGTSHFIGGSVANGKDTGDPATMAPNEDKNIYNQYGGDHALGYLQMETIYLGSHLNHVYPSGEYEDKEYNNETDRYTMDEELNFIRPNIGYVPDLIYSATMNSGSFYKAASNIWGQLQNENWFNSLSQDEKTFLHCCMYQMQYMGSGIDEANLQVMVKTVKLAWAVKEDGYIDDIRYFADFIVSRYKEYSGLYFYKNINGNRVFSRIGTYDSADALNTVLSDSANIGTNTKSVAKEVRDAISKASAGTENSYGYYQASTGYKFRHGVPGNFMLQTFAEKAYKDLKSEIANAEKESGGNLTISGGNYLEYVGSGLFANPENSEYYCPELGAIWFSQGSSYRGGSSIFGTTLPAYTSTLQDKKFYGSGTYNIWGCPSYSAAALLSNMLGTEILADELPGTTTAKDGWDKGGRNVAASGYSAAALMNYTIPAVNNTLERNKAGFTLKYKGLTESELANVENHLYEWLDAGAMIYIRITMSLSNHYGGNHYAVIAGYDKSKKVGDWYELRILNSIVGNNIYTLTDCRNGQGASADLLNRTGLAYHLRNYGSTCAVVVWRSDMAESLPGL